MNFISRRRVVIYASVLICWWILSNNHLYIVGVSHFLVKQILMPTFSSVVIHTQTRYLDPGPRETNVREGERVFIVPDNQALVANLTIGRRPHTMLYERCLHVPKAPTGMVWAEEAYIDDRPPRSLNDIVNKNKSKVFLVGPAVVKLGQTIKLKIVLHNGKGKRRRGKDLVRVWMKEDSVFAGSVAKVTNNLDGSYSAELMAFWVGKPNIVVAVISPKEVLATQFQRRYICPAVILFHAVFVNKVNKDMKNEWTQCSYYPQVPGYSELCNFTEENYGRPWYCGKPRSNGTKCKDWTYLAAKQVFDHENLLNTPMERQLYTRDYQTMIIPNNDSVEILQDQENTTWIPPDINCNIPNRSHTWSEFSPTGYLYRRKWTVRSCRGSEEGHDLPSCFKDLKMLLIGDSTVRQIYSELTHNVICEWETSKINNSNKHGQFKCSNKTLRFNLEYNSHELPFRTAMTNHRYFKSINSHLNANHNIDGKHGRVVILIHIYSHFMNYHSHVFYESLIRMKPAILNLLNTNENATVIIKGPHSYAFQFDTEKFLRKPEGYLEVYEDYTRRVFGDVKERIIYLNVADITIATEQSTIHPRKFIVSEIVNMIFNYICKY